MNSIKGVLAAGVALVACPCHLPLTLPLLLALTGGSAFGLWLAQNQWLVWLAATGLFVGGLFLAFVWLGQGKEGAACEVSTQRRKTSRPVVPSQSES